MITASVARAKTISRGKAKSSRPRANKPELGRYEIHEILGKGAGSKIFRATDSRDGREVAIKHVTEETIHERLADVGEYKPHRNNKPIDYTSFFDQLKLEYEVCRGLSKTPVRNYVPEVYALKTVRKYGFLTAGYDLIMEYIPGPTLREERDYPIKDIVKFYYQTARILYGMHSIGWLHCDLKPQHLVVSAERSIKLLDFGQCRKPWDGARRMQGTPDYMAPEQLKGCEVDESTDIYSLGASMYWILTGKSNRPAMAGASVGAGFHVGYGERAQSIREENPAVPEPLERLILDSCEPKAIDRPISMREVMERLDRLR